MMTCTTVNEQIQYFKTAIYIIVQKPSLQQLFQINQEMEYRQQLPIGTIYSYLFKIL